MRTLSILTVVVLAGGSIAAYGQTVPAAATGQIIPREEILNGLRIPGQTRGLTRSIGVAAKPQITTQAILFKFGTTEIEGRPSQAQIEELGHALEDATLKNAVIEIEGHTDNVGSDAYNQKLSQARAGKIVQALQQYHLAVKQLIPRGKGKSEPVAGTRETQTDEERAQNRRVVIKRTDQ